MASPQSFGEESMERLSRHSDLVGIYLNILDNWSSWKIELFGQALGSYPDPGGGDLSCKSSSLRSSN